MKTIMNNNHNPYFNLALEEYLLKYLEVDEDIFYLWQNEKSIIIGRNQNPFLEVNMKVINNKKIPLIRRISGGGTVFHDIGNLNFTYIKNGLKKHLNNYTVFLDPLINILKKAGIKARFVEKSHIFIGDKKISGNAQSFYKDRVIHHGTLLFDTDLQELEEVLKNNDDYKTHSIRSNKVLTTNIKNHMQVSGTIEDLKEFILNNMFNQDYKSNILQLTKKDLKVINKISEEKYKSWAWNFGEISDYEIKKKVDEKFVVMIRIQKGVIQSVISDSELELDKYLVGVQLKKEELVVALKNSKLEDIENFIEQILY